MSSEKNNSFFDMIGIGDLNRTILFVFIFCLLHILYIMAPSFYGAHNIKGVNLYETNFNDNKGFCLIRFNYDEHKNVIPKPNTLDIYKDDTIFKEMYKENEEQLKLVLKELKIERSNTPVSTVDSQYFYDYSKYDPERDQAYTATNTQMALDYAHDSDLLYIYHVITSIILGPFNIIEDFSIRIVEFLEKYLKEIIQNKYVDLIFAIIFFILLTINLMKFFEDFQMSIKNFIVNMFTGLSYIIIGYYMLQTDAIFHILKILLIFQHVVVSPDTVTITDNITASDIISPIVSKLSSLMHFILHYDTFFGVLTITSSIRIIYIAFFALCITNLMSFIMYYLGLLILCYIFSPIIPIFIGCCSILPLKFNVLISFYLNFTIIVPLALSFISTLFGIIGGVLHFSLPLSICYVNGPLHGFSYWYMYDTNSGIMPKHLYFFVVTILILMVYNKCSDEITNMFQTLFNTEDAIIKVANLPSLSFSVAKSLLSPLLKYGGDQINKIMNGGDQINKIMNGGDQINKIMNTKLDGKNDKNDKNDNTINKKALNEDYNKENDKNSETNKK